MKALLLVDIQNDFLPGGPLGVPEGDRVVPVANALAPEFDLVVATQDWHPPGHVSFAANHEGREPGEVIEVDGLEQILWPVHCVQGTPGAELAPGLKAPHEVIRKGSDPRLDSYSGFFANGRRKATGLSDLLRECGAGEVHVMGLATDYCVKFTALDAVDEGFDTVLRLDGCRAVNLREGDGERAVEEMRQAGVKIA